MALDTALKRASAVNVASPWRGILPFPDGTVEEDDRQTTAFLYALDAAPASVDAEHLRIIAPAVCGTMMMRK